MKLKAYKGSEPYVFVSYAHADMAVVYSEIERLQNKGCRIWFDEGIPPSSEWPEEIARAIDRCTFFIAFLSRSAVASKYVTREIQYAVEQNRKYLTVYLQETALSPGLKWLLGTRQALLKYRLEDAEYFAKLTNAIPQEILPGAKTHGAEEPHLRPREFDPALDSELVKAGHRGATGEIRTLLARGADPNARMKMGWKMQMIGGLSSLMESPGRFGQWLFKGGESGSTALEGAAANGHVEALKVLIEAGAELDAGGSLGLTALMCASERGCVEVAKTLLDAGADPNARGESTSTALIRAAAHGHVEVVRTLIQAGAALNLSEIDGYTSLMRAAENGHVEVARVLITAGAALNARDVLGRTALEHAKGKPEVEQVLRAAGARQETSR